MHEPIRKRADEPLLAVGRRRWRLLVIVASITGTLVVGGGASVPASHAATASGACPPIPASKLRSVLGLDSSLVMRNTVDDSGGVVTYECNTVAWSGPEPASLEAAFQTAKSGHAAQVGIETWTPNDGSPDLQRWLKTDYDELTGRFDIAATLPHFGSKQGWPLQVDKARARRLRIPAHRDGRAAPGADEGTRGGNRVLVGRPVLLGRVPLR